MTIDSDAKPAAGDHVSAENLSAYLDGELTHSDRLAVEAHLASCRACRDELAALTWSVEFTRAMPRTQVPPGFSFHVPVAEPSVLDEASGRSGLSILAWGSMAVAAAAVVLAVLQARPFAMTGAPSAELAARVESVSDPPAAAVGAGAEIGGGGDIVASDAVTEAQSQALAEAEAVATREASSESGGAAAPVAPAAPGGAAAAPTSESAPAMAHVQATPTPTRVIARVPSGPRAAALAPQSDSGATARWIALALGAMALAVVAFWLGRRSRS